MLARCCVETFGMWQKKGRKQDSKEEQQEAAAALSSAIKQGTNVEKVVSPPAAAQVSICIQHVVTVPRFLSRPEHGSCY